MTYSNSWYRKEYLLGLGGLGGGAGGILVAGGPIATSDDGYQIEKSLVLEEDDQAELIRSKPTLGNTRTWTLSWWVKRSGTLINQWIFSSYRTSGGNYVNIGFYDDNFYSFIGGNPDASSMNYASIISNAKYRDYGAWMHCVVAFDADQDIASERHRAWINGEQITSYTGNDTPRYMNTYWNSTYDSEIGSSGADNDQWCSLYLADVYAIDGLALSPSAFAGKGSAGLWTSKAFARPNPNDGTTWSDSVASGGVVTAGSDFRSGYPATRVFTGTRKTSTAQMAATEINAADKYMEFNFGTEGINCSVLDLNIDHNNEGPVYVNGVDITNQLANNNFTWQPITGRCLQDGKLKTIKLGPDKNTDGSALYFGGIRVDGVILKDDKTDLTTRNNVNDNTKWSDGFSGSVWGSNYEHALAFNGTIQNGALASAGGSITWTGSVAFSKLELALKVVGSYGNVTVNGTNVNSQLLHDNWAEITGISSPLTEMVFPCPDASNYSWLLGVRIDDHVLIDESIDNSSHLKFNDASRNSAVGKDILNGKIEDATGALPIYNTKAGTTDNEIDYGDVKDTGYRTDSSSGTTDGAGLVFAMPGDTLTDIHASINTGSSNNTITTWYGGLTSSTADSRFYGSSIRCDGAGVLQTNNTTDFRFGTGPFCIEMWVKDTSGTQDRGFFHLSGDSGWAAANGISFYMNVDKWRCRVKTGSGDSALVSTRTASKNEWVHLAVTSDGTNGNLKFFVDGKLEDTATQAHDVTGIYGGYVNIGGYYGGSYRWTGYLQDIRMYRVQKYSATFKAPRRNNWEPINIGGGAKNYSQYWTGTGPVGGNNGGVFANDSTTSHGDHGSGGTGTHIVWTPSPAITINSSARVYMTQGSASQCTINGTSFTTTNNAWNDITSHCSGTLSTFRLDAGAGSAWAKVWQIEIDGEVLKDTNVYTDSPTNYGTDEGTGGEVRGNYCVLNPIDYKVRESSAISNGGLTHTGCSGQSGWSLAGGTIAVPSDDTDGFYFEVKIDHKWNGAGWWDVDVAGGISISDQGYKPGDAAGGNSYDQGTCYQNVTITNFGTGDISTSGTIGTTAAGDVIGCAVKNNKIYYARNNTWTGDPSAESSPAITLSEKKNLIPFLVEISIDGSTQGVSHVNFGQLPFKYAAPTGYKSICTENLPDTFSGTELNNPSKFFDIIAYTGDSVDGRVLGGLNFKPDLLWFKQRSGTAWHILYDAIRGTGSMLFPAENNSQGTDAHITAFNDDGVTIQHVDSGTINADGGTYVGWFWDVGTSASGANTNGSINIADGNQWVNDTAGFSITKFTSTGSSGATVGHGLSAAPEFMIIKSTSVSGDWGVYHKGIGLPATTDGGLVLNTADQTNTASDWWASTNPTSTVFSLGNKDTVNPSGSRDMMAYCWTSIPGYSAFGTYTGNGSSDGPFIYTGFRPKFVMFKKTSAGGGWVFLDTERDNTNPTNLALYIDENSAEASWNFIDTLSNGFKHRQTGSYHNANGATHVWAAFAEHPLKTARAR